jgi:hypothetical protein
VTLIHWFANLLVTIVATILTARHLWLVDYFSLAFPIIFSFGVTLINKNETLLDWPLSL